jgi:hypothetical protein
MHHHRIIGTVPFVVAMGLAACSVKEAPSTADTGAAAASTAAAPQTAANVVHIVAKDYTFDSPAQIPAGLTTLHLMNQGKEAHQAELIKLTEGKTYEDFMAAVRAMTQNTPPPSWVVFDGGPNAAAPAGTAESTQTLEAGNYALVCFIPSTDGQSQIMKGMSRGLVVTPSNATPAAEPTPTTTMTLSDYKFDLSSPLKSGQNVVRVENAADQPHEVVIFKLPPGKTMKDFEAWLPVSDKQPPPAIPSGGVVGLSKGRHVFFTANLEPGDYVFICFIGDAKDGKPHFTHGMVQPFKIT